MTINLNLADVERIAQRVAAILEGRKTFKEGRRQVNWAPGSGIGVAPGLRPLVAQIAGSSEEPAPSPKTVGETRHHRAMIQMFDRRRHREPQYSTAEILVKLAAIKDGNASLIDENVYFDVTTLDSVMAHIKGLQELIDMQKEKIDRQEAEMVELERTIDAKSHEIDRQRDEIGRLRTLVGAGAGEEEAARLKSRIETLKMRVDNQAETIGGYQRLYGTDTKGFPISYDLPSNERPEKVASILQAAIMSLTQRLGKIEAELGSPS